MAILRNNIFKTILEIRGLIADKVEVYKILRSFDGTDELKCFQRWVGSTRGHDLKLYRKRAKIFPT